MPRLYHSLTLEDARRMLFAAEPKAANLGIAYNIAVVDAGGHLLAFGRQDGPPVGSIAFAVDKAVTARLFDKATFDLTHLAQSDRPLFGIQESNADKVVIFSAASLSRSTKAKFARSKRAPGRLSKTLPSRRKQ